MDNVDAVAQAICERDWGGRPFPYFGWESLNGEKQQYYRRMARAAIDALGLTEEWRCIGREVQSRLVSGRVRKDNTNE